MRRSSHRRPRSRFPFKLILLICLALALIFVAISCGQSDQVDTPNDSAVSSPLPSESPELPSDTAEPDESASSAPDEVPTEEPIESPIITELTWNLVLINKWNPMPEGFKPETSTLPNGLLIDSRIYDPLMAMINDCKAAGLSPIICSAYRTFEKQTELFERKINKYMNAGYTYDEAYAKASTIVAIPGTSEHNIGLAVDICALDYQILDEAQENTPEQQWLMAHCHEYGFILRYPTNKTDLTGIIYEPWHYRYVGVEAATEIMSTGICLEEYYELHFGSN